MRGPAAGIKGKNGELEPRPRGVTGAGEGRRKSARARAQGCERVRGKSMAGERGRINLKLKFRSPLEQLSSSSRCSSAPGTVSSGAAIVLGMFEAGNALQRSVALWSSFWE